MAIVQISQITQRKGLQTDLPDPLAGGELGWSIDERRLFIGNGTLQEGAPTVGNTELLTEYSNIAVLIANANITVANLTVSGTISSVGNIRTAGTLISNSVTSNSVVATGNVTANVVSANTVVGILRTAGQPNITSVGTLNSLTVDGNAAIGSFVITKGLTGNITANAVSNVISISNTTPAAQITYSIVSNTGNVGFGTVQVVGVTGAGTVANVVDTRTENGTLNITLGVTQASNAAPIVITANNTSSNSATMSYSISYFN